MNNHQNKGRKHRKGQRKEAPQGCYAREKPEECEECYLYHPGKKTCALGGLYNCYFRLRPSRAYISPCEECGFRNCSGLFCYRSLMKKGQS